MHPTKNTNARKICKQQWERRVARIDPCDSCPLAGPCLKVTPPGLDAFARWIKAINRKADAISNSEV